MNQMRKISLSFLIASLMLAMLFAMVALAAPASAPNIDGTIDVGEYGVHIDGQNQQTSGSTVTYMSWDDTNLYIAISNANVFEGAVFYIDTNPLSPANDGTDTDGTLVGQNYDSTNFTSLPFRADFVAYYKNGYREYRTADGSNGWSAQTTGFGSYADNGASVREIAIPWSDIASGVTDFGGSDRPPSFSFFHYVTSGSGFVYGQVPTTNAGGTFGTTADYANYYLINDTTVGSGTPPFSNERNVYADQVVINEFTAKGTEWVELYNATAVTVTITGWYLDDADCGAGTSFIGTQDIGPSNFFVVNSGDAGDNFSLDNSGDLIILCNSSNTEIDRASFGTSGSAPIGPLAAGGPQYSTARIGDGQDTNNDAADWNIDVSPTQGMTNDVPLNDLGGSILINEIDAFPVSGNDMIELYNPTTQTVTVTNWLISDGDDVAILSGTLVLPSGGFLALEENVDWTTEGSTGVDFASTDVAYLFDTARVRVDQLGWAGEFEDDCFARVPDGAGPNDGYNWVSSGGNSTLFDQPCTLGATNTNNDVTISKTGPIAAQAGNLIDYTITYENVGNVTVNDIWITDTLPLSVTYNSDNSGLTCPTCVVGASTIGWQVSSIGAGNSSSFTLTALVDSNVSAGTILTNTIIITSTDDGNAANNEAEWVTTISSMDLSVTKAGPALATSDQPYSYVIGLENQGNVSATNVIVTDTLPLSSTYVSDDSGWTCAACIPGATGVLTWSVGNMMGGSNASFNLTVTADISPTPSLLITNTVTATTDTAGDNTANNTATASTTVWNIVPIAVARAGSDGEDFAVIGRVTYIPGTYNSSGWGFQDDSGGIGVFYNPPPAINLGDVILLAARRSSFSGEEQFGTPVQAFINMGAGALVDPMPYSTGDLAAGLSEGWLSVISGTISGLTCPPTFNHSFMLDDGSGPAQVFVDGTTGVNACDLGLLDGRSAIIVGFSTENNGTFQIKPRFPADVTLIADEPIIYKTAPGVVGMGELYTYTLTVENYLGYTMTSPTMFDEVPDNVQLAYILDGGTWAISGTTTIVGWPTLPDIPDQGSLSVRFAVTSTNVLTTIVNSTYYVQAVNYLTATYGQPVTTTVSPPLRIHDIQGASHVSPYDGQTVQDIPGIVTVVRTASFYMQDPNPDGDEATSEGINVFTGAAPTVSVGDAVLVSGDVNEYVGGSGDLSITEIDNPTIVVTSTGNVIPAAIIVGTNGRIPPNTIIDDDSFAVFDPANDGIDFYESLEGMLVEVQNAIVVGTKRFDEIQIVGDNGANATTLSPRGTIVISDGDFNPERIIIDDAIIANEPFASVGYAFTDIVTGVMDYSFGNFKLLNAVPLPPLTSGGLLSETSALVGTADQLTVASFNVLNLDPGDSTFDALADEIVNHLNAPDIIGLQEIQDNNGPIDDGTVDANLTYFGLIAAILNAGGPEYEFRDIAPENNMDGGQPGANIRVGFLFRLDRVTFVDRLGGTATNATTPTMGANGVELTFSPGRIQPNDAAFSNSRKPLAAEFIFNGHTVFVVANHFNSKGGDDPLFGSTQPPVLGSEAQRIQQAQIVHDFVDSVLTLAADANVIVLGDLNDFQFSLPLQTLKGSILDNLTEHLAANEQYTYIFDGNAQALDHILATFDLADFADIDVVHVNVEYDASVHPTDHDPVLARFSLPVAADVAPTAVTLSGPTTGETDTAYTFTATVTPISTTLPITYTWTADNQTTMTQVVTGTMDSVAYAWVTSGVQMITVTAANNAGMVMATHAITISAPPDPDVAPTAVNLTGPSTGTINTAYTFDAAVLPISTTLPLTFTWMADEQTAVSQSVNGLMDSVSFTWTTTGTKTILVTAANSAGIVTDTHTIVITAGVIIDDGFTIYLPFIVNDSASTTTTSSGIDWLLLRYAHIRE